MVVPALLLFGLAALDGVLAALAYRAGRSRMAVVTAVLGVLAAAAGVLLLRIPVPAA